MKTPELTLHVLTSTEAVRLRKAFELDPNCGNLGAYKKANYSLGEAGIWLATMIHAQGRMLDYFDALTEEEQRLFLRIIGTPKEGSTT